MKQEILVVIRLLLINFSCKIQILETPLIRRKDFSAKTLKVNGSIEASSGYKKSIGSVQTLTDNGQKL